MFIDADDLVSKDFAQQIEQMFHRNPDADDIVFYTGYVRDARRDKIAYLDGATRIFYKNCGSCFVSKLGNSDLEEHDETNTFLFSLKDHTKFPDSSLQFGRSVMALKIPVVCYIVNHGSNDSAERTSSAHIESFVDHNLCQNTPHMERYNVNFT